MRRLDEACTFCQACSCFYSAYVIEHNQMLSFQSSVTAYNISDPCIFDSITVAAARLKRLLSFAVGGLLGDVFLHLLPEAWRHVNKGKNLIIDFIELMVYWLARECKDIVLQSNGVVFLFSFPLALYIFHSKEKQTIIPNWVKVNWR